MRYGENPAPGPEPAAGETRSRVRDTGNPPCPGRHSRHPARSPVNRREFEAITEALGSRIRASAAAGGDEAAWTILELAGDMAARLADASPGFDRQAFLSGVRASASLDGGPQRVRVEGDERFGEEDIEEIDGIRAFLRSGQARLARDRAGLSRAETGKACNAADKAVSDWEEGQAIPDGEQALAYGRLLASRQPAGDSGPEPFISIVPDKSARDAVLANLVTVKGASDRLGISYAAAVGQARRSRDFPEPVLSEGRGQLYWWPDFPQSETRPAGPVPGKATRDAVLANLVTLNQIAARSGVPSRTAIAWAGRQGFPGPLPEAGHRNQRYWWPDILRYRNGRQEPPLPRLALIDGRAVYSGPDLPAPASAGWTITHEEFEAGCHWFHAAGNRHGDELGDAYATEIPAGMPGAGHVVVESLHVADGSRGKGIGTNLLAGIDAQFPGREIRIPAGSREPGTAQVRDFCRRRGFTAPEGTEGDDRSPAGELARTAPAARVPAGRRGTGPGAGKDPAALNFTGPFPPPVPPGASRHPVATMTAAAANREHARPSR